MGLAPRRGAFLLDDVLLNEVASPGFGPLVLLHNVHPTTFTVEGDFEGSVTVYVTNNPKPNAETAEHWAVLEKLTKPGRCKTDGPYHAAIAKFTRKSGGVTVACCGATDVGHENGSLR